METWVAFLLTALTSIMFGFVVCLAIVLVVGRSWMGLKPPKPVKAPQSVTQQGDLHQATSPTPKVVKSA